MNKDLKKCMERFPREMFFLGNISLKRFKINDINNCLPQETFDYMINSFKYKLKGDTLITFSKLYGNNFKYSMNDGNIVILHNKNIYWYYINSDYLTDLKVYKFSYNLHSWVIAKNKNNIIHKHYMINKQIIWNYKFKFVKRFNIDQEGNKLNTEIKKSIIYRIYNTYIKTNGEFKIFNKIIERMKYSRKNINYNMSFRYFYDNKKSLIFINARNKFHYGVGLVLNNRFLLLFCLIKGL